MKFDSGREHVRRMIGIFLVLVGCEEILRGLVIERQMDRCSRGGGRRLCKENVGWIVDLNNFLMASWCVCVCGVNAASGCVNVDRSTRPAV